MSQRVRSRAFEYRCPSCSDWRKVKVAIVITLALAFCGMAQAKHRHHGLTPSEKWAQTSFARCARWRESHNGATAQNLYEIEGPKASGNYGDYDFLDGVSRKQQNQIAYQMYLARGDGPWRQYDHCYSGMYYPYNGY